MGRQNLLSMLLAVSLAASAAWAQESDASKDDGLTPEFLEKAGLTNFVPLNDTSLTSASRSPTTSLSVANLPNDSPDAIETISPAATSAETPPPAATLTDELAAQLAVARRRYADAAARAGRAAVRERAARTRLSQANELISSSRAAIESASTELNAARRDVQSTSGEIKKLELQLVQSKLNVTVATARAENQRLLKAVLAAEVELKDANRDLSAAQDLLRTANASTKSAFDAAQQQRQKFDLLKRQRDGVSLAITSEEFVIKQLRESLRELTRTPEARDDKEVSAVAAEVESLVQSKLKRVEAMRLDESKQTAALKDAYRQLAEFIRAANEQMEAAAATHRRVAQLTVARETAMQARDVASQAVQRSEKELARLEQSAASSD